MDPWSEVLKQLEVRDVLEKKDSKYFEAFNQLSHQLEIARLNGQSPVQSPSTGASPSPTPSLITSGRERDKEKEKERDKEKSESPQNDAALLRLNQQLQRENRKLIGTLNEMTIRMEKAEYTLTLNKRQVASLEASVEKLGQKVANLNLQLREKDKSIEIINDELLSNQIQINVLNTDIEKLKHENDVLIERWMDKVRKDAEKMNDANQFLDSIKRE